MAITITDSTKEPRSWSVGPVKFQIVDYVANSGATTGTLTADKLARLDHVIFSSSKLKHTSAPTYATNVATLAFTVPTETAASLIVQDLTYTAVANLGASGNSITIAYLDPADTDVPISVSVVGTAIAVTLATDNLGAITSTATEVKAAIDGSAAALALVSVAITGTGSNVQAAAVATPLAGGVTGGARSSALCIGV